MIGSINNFRVKGDKEWFRSEISVDAINLLKSMLSFNPKKRPTAT